MPNSKNNREGDDEYSGVVAQVGPRARVVICRDGLQFILQTREGAAWRARRFFATRAALLSQLSDVVPEAITFLASLPSLARDRSDTRAPHRAPEAAELDLCSGHG
ncbi:hypothetical protein V5F49_05030 [Xanthobacter sp. V3C-3]|uniref:hypothetical protein n=1 Tax=Xanthobacter lutulentifluminis TaxID=3119935 RepID=UPI00372BAE26